MLILDGLFHFLMEWAVHKESELSSNPNENHSLEVLPHSDFHNSPSCHISYVGIHTGSPRIFF